MHICTIRNGFIFSNQLITYCYFIQKTLYNTPYLKILHAVIYVNWFLKLFFSANKIHNLLIDKGIFSNTVPDYGFSFTVKRTRWTTPEKQEVFRILRRELEEKRIPSTARCQEMLKNNNILLGRTPEMLRAFVNNTNKKNSSV